MKEESRRRIARKFLKETFGWCPDINRSYKSMPLLENDARAFYMFHAPYVTDTTRPWIAVSDNAEEIKEIAKLEATEGAWKAGLVEFEQYGKYFIAYD